MDYYGTLRNEYIHKEMYPTEHRVDYFPKGPFTGSSVKITPKPNCVPRFVSKIEGNAVEEGEKVFFEGIVDAQPQPIFSWYFNDEPIEAGRPGWEDAEVHDSRKMSTLILTYAREHHMGKYTVVAQNRMGHTACSCDLIVRKKQFPPVFWQRLYNYEATAGSKLIAEVEVGGWPIPELVWYKDDEPVMTTLHTENYNGFPNKYVPDRRVEVRQIDPIRHCIIFHRISESDAGLYTVVATNALGEAICQAQFIIEPGEGGGADLYIPEKWRTGNRMNWAMEDARAKKFVGQYEPELTDEEIAEMTSRVSGAPLPRALEYLAALPDYYPTPMEGLVPMTFKPDVDGTGRRDGKKGGKPSRPSKFVPEKINHTGYVSDDLGAFLPMWFNEFNPNARDPYNMAYQPISYDYQPRVHRERPKSPPCPHIWESHEVIDDLYKLLDTVGCRILLSDVSKDAKMNASHTSGEHKSYLKKTPEARKQIIHYENKKQDESIKGKQVQKFSYLNPSKSTPGAKDKTDASKSGNEDTTGAKSLKLEEENQRSGEEELGSGMVEVPPALPPKTKIMFSPSRHLFSPTENLDSSDDNASVQTVEYIPVKEKVKMIAQQQEEIFRKEERKRTTGQTGDIAPPTGGVRILPPSPVTVRRSAFSEENMSSQHHATFSKETSSKSHHTEEKTSQHRSAFSVESSSQHHVTFSQERHTDKSEDELEEFEKLVAQAQLEQQQHQMLLKQQQQVKQLEQQKLHQQQLEQQKLQQLEEQNLQQLEQQKLQQQKQQQLEQQKLQQLEQQKQKLEQQKLQQQKQQQLILKQQQQQIEQEKVQQQKLQQQMLQKQQELDQQLLMLQQQKLLEQQLFIKQQQEMAILEEQRREELFQLAELQAKSTSSQHQEDDEVMYISEVSSQQSETQTKTTTSMAKQQQASTLSGPKTEAVLIPRLEDKYGLENNLEELSSTIGSEESFISVQTTGLSTSTTSHSMMGQTIQSGHKASSIRSGYSTLSQEESSTLKQSTQSSVTSQQSVKTMQDSTYSTASQSSSHFHHQGAAAMTSLSGVTFKEREDDREVEAISNRLGGKSNEKSSNVDESRWNVRDSTSVASPSFAASPRTGRKPRVDSSPRRQDDESPKYRTPPSTPFQPSFYKKPPEDESRSNLFPLPSPNLRRSRPHKTKGQASTNKQEDDVSDSDEENRV